MFHLYRLFNADGELLYIGVTRQLAGHRIQAHRKQPWFAEVTRHEITVLHCSKADAQALELAAIRAEQPRYNTIGRTAPARPRPPARPAPQRPAPDCGTYRAAKRHIRRGEELDEACQAELRRYMADAQQRTRDRRRANDPPIGHQVRT